ncbi:unnamed protein product [Clavelina lepadiformis]|uniref:Uncharacterized protein n=1 Tax=Clavelina lepadiformis TaxID=159417 RepID=A0ABP0G8V0_CLALP
MAMAIGRTHIAWAIDFKVSKLYNLSLHNVIQGIIIITFSCVMARGSQYTGPIREIKVLHLVRCWANFSTSLNKSSSFRFQNTVSINWVWEAPVNPSSLRL